MDQICVVLVTNYAIDTFCLCFVSCHLKVVIKCQKLERNTLHKQIFYRFDKESH